MDRLFTLIPNLYVVGGHVRDRLLERSSGDVDFITSMSTQDLLSLLTSNEIPCYVNGVVVATIDGVKYDISTWRKSPTEDCYNRDFTINAMYLDGDGNVIDPLGGADDLTHKRLRFIGGEEKAITEDPIRLLRWFRFKAMLHSESTTNLSPYVHLIDNVSHERLRNELFKLFDQPDFTSQLSDMKSCGLLEKLGLDFNGSTITATSHIGKLATLMVKDIGWKLTRQQQRLLEFLIQHRHRSDLTLLSIDHPNETKELAAVQGVDYVPAPTIPVKAGDFGAGRWVKTKYELAKKRWCESNFTATKDELLSL